MPFRRCGAASIAARAPAPPAGALGQKSKAGFYKKVGKDVLRFDLAKGDYVPAGADDAYFAPPDDGFVPVFDSEPSARPVAASAAPAAVVVDVSKLPPGIPLDAIGFEGDWPALAATLPLKGISFQLAFNSELTALDGAARAERQRDAEREIGSDPFVQQLIRDFGASIVPGSIRPLSPDAAGSGGAQATH